MAAEAGAADEKKSAEQFPIPGAQFVKQLVLPGNVSTTTNSIQSMITVDGGKYLWACCNEGTIVVWDARTGAVLGSRQAHKATIFDMICVSNASNPYAPDSCTVWVASLDSTITCWNTSLSILKRMNLGGSSTTALVQVDSNVWIADAKSIFVVDAQTRELVATIDLPTKEFLVSSSNGSEIPLRSSSGSPSKGLATEAMQNSPSVLHMDRSSTIAVRGRVSANTQPHQFVGYFVRCLCLVGDYVWVCTDHWVCFIDKNTFAVLSGVHIPTPKINSIAYIKPTNKVWGACSDGSIYIYEADANILQKGEIGATRCLSGWSEERVSKLVNLDDKYVYVGSWDKYLRIWDAQSEEMIFQQSKSHECPIMAIVLLPYPWLKVVGPKTSTKSNSGPLSTSPRTEQAKRLLSVSSDTLRANNSHQELSALASSSSSPAPDMDVEATTIMTLVTADWSSVSLWA